MILKIFKKIRKMIAVLYINDFVNKYNYTNILVS